MNSYAQCSLFRCTWKNGHLSPLWLLMTFFLTHQRPHHPATEDTIARWVKTVLHLSGVDIDIYKPHSCRSASTSHAKLAGVPLEDIMQTGQWKFSDCFTTFYDREIEQMDFTTTQPFADSILNALPTSD